MVAFSRDDLLQIVVPLVEAILEVVADAVQQVVVDEVAVERLRSCALLGGSVKVRISLLDSDVALSEQVLLDGIDDHVRLKAQRKQKLDDLLAALVDVHTYFIEILAPAPDRKECLHHAHGVALGYRLEEADDMSLNHVEMCLEVLFMANGMAVRNGLIHLLVYFFANLL
jgi:hypothetical protein